MARAAKTLRVGVRVRTLRNQAGITQAQLAENVGITPESMSRIERGRLQPSTELVVKLADALGVGPGDLFEVTNVVPKSPDLRPIERRLLREVRDLPDAHVEDVLTAVRLLVNVGRSGPVRVRKKRS